MALSNPSVADTQQFSKEIFLVKEKYHLPIEAYEQRALYELNRHILQKHVRYEISWPAWVIEQHKEILKKEIISHLEVEIPNVSITLKNKKQNSLHIVFTYGYVLPSERVYSISSGDVEEFIVSMGSRKSINSLLGLELFFAYPAIFKFNKKQKIERWERALSGESKTLIFNLPIVDKKILERSAIIISMEETEKSFAEEIAIFDLMPFNPSVCSFISKKLSVTFPAISERVQDRCPKIDIQNLNVNELNRKSNLEYTEVLAEIRILEKETGLQFEKLPILTSIFNSLGTMNLKLKEFTEVSIEDLYGDQGLYFSMENFENNYSLDRLAIVSKQLSDEGYKNLSKVIEKQIKFIAS